MSASHFCDGLKHKSYRRYPLRWLPTPPTPTPPATIWWMPPPPPLSTNSAFAPAYTFNSRMVILARYLGPCQVTLGKGHLCAVTLGQSAVFSRTEKRCYSDLELNYYWYPEVSNAPGCIICINITTWQNRESCLTKFFAMMVRLIACILRKIQVTKKENNNRLTFQTHWCIRSETFVIYQCIRILWKDKLVGPRELDLWLINKCFFFYHSHEHPFTQQEIRFLLPRL